MGISLKTHKMLWGRSGNRCAFPSCRRLLVEDESQTDDASIVGDEAHIVAREIDGPRGQSLLTSEERDKFDNLVLLCKIHHKQIDDQPNNFTIDVLQKMKNEHLNWVNLNLNPNINKQKEDELYAKYIDKWIELANVTNWKNWTSFVFGSGQPRISANQLNNLIELNEYIYSRIWPRQYANVEFAFNNFRLILNDFINVFNVYRENIGESDELWYSTEKIYKRLKEWDNEEYHRLVKKFDYYVDLVQDLACELTRSANYLCDQVRNCLSSSFRLKEGVLLISVGPDMNFFWKTVRLEFDSNKESSMSYPGLEKFMITRSNRDYSFGKGVNKDYLR